MYTIKVSRKDYKLIKHALDMHLITLEGFIKDNVDELKAATEQHDKAASLYEATDNGREYRRTERLLQRL